MATTDPYQPLVPDQTILNEVKYAARDFVSMADEILRRMKIEYGTVYNDYESTAVAMMLRDIVCWAHAHTQWNMDRRASDLYLRTARTPSTVSAIVEQIGYKMAPATSSVETLTLTFPDGTDTGFEMKDRWKFQGPNGLIFESYAKKVVSSALGAGGTITVDVRQGETKVATFASDGKKNQIYKLSGVPDGKFLANAATDVWVDGSIWVEKDFLEFAEDPIYEINYLANPPTIRFGDGIAGNIPPNTAEIKIRYVVIDGEKGNVKAGTIASSTDTLFVGGASVSFDVTNLVRTSGGADPESIERARRLAPVSFAARGAAITQADYEALSESYYSSTFGRVAKVYAHSPRNSYSDTIFNALITDISNALDAYSDLISGVEESVATSGNGLNEILASMAVSMSAMDALQVSLDTSISSAISTGQGARSAAVTAYTSASNSADKTSEASTLLDDMITWIDDSGENAAFVNLVIQGDDEHAGLLDVKTLVDGANTESLSAKNRANEVIQAMDTILDTHLANALSYTTVTLVNEIDSLNSDITAMDGTMNDSSVGIIAELTSLSGSYSEMSSAILATTDAMRVRIADIFDDDCQSNYVQVPILSLDVDGNYVAPSIGLTNALQQYLNTVKEVTQLVEVIDGSDILVPADIVVDAEIYPAYVKSEVKSQMEQVIARMLKGRGFAAPLYLSDLYKNIKACSNGIKRFNVEITGPITSPSVIIGGNLIPGDNKIVIAGTVTVTVAIA